jgi:murein DD-endopeptidase MepM/ murein hydrolase activator NlpD
VAEKKKKTAAEDAAARSAAALKAMDDQIRKASSFSKATTRSLARDPAGKTLHPGAKGRLGLAPQLALVLLVAALASVALPPFSWPIRGRITSGWAFRLKPDSHDFLDIEFHRGMDIAAPIGSLVLATAPGRVVATGSSPTAGNYVILRHLLGFESRYYHLEKIDVAQGRLILLPLISPIGNVGSTGRSTGPHLHFELEARGLALPPRLLLGFHSLRLWLLGF